MTVIWSEVAGPADAPLVVLVHGTMDRSTGMLKVSRRLDSRFRVVRYDRRGYGRSAPHDGPFEMSSQVADLVSVLDGRQAVIVAHSYGGNVAMATAARHPDLIQGVALFESPLSWEPWWPGSTAGSAARAGTGEEGDAAEAFMRRMIGNRRWETLPERTRLTRRAEGKSMVGELRDLHENAPWSASDIMCPVVAGYGSLSSEHHREGMRLVSERVRRGVVVELIGVRHDAPLSHAEMFTTMIVDPLMQMVGGRWAQAASITAESY